MLTVRYLYLVKHPPQDGPKLTELLATLDQIVVRPRNRNAPDARVLPNNRGNSLWIDGRAEGQYKRCFATFHRGFVDHVVRESCCGGPSPSLRFYIINTAFIGGL